MPPELTEYVRSKLFPLGTRFKLNAPGAKWGEGEGEAIEYDYCDEDNYKRGWCVRIKWADSRDSYWGVLDCDAVRIRNEWTIQYHRACCPQCDASFVLTTDYICQDCRAQIAS